MVPDLPHRYALFDTPTDPLLLNAAGRSAVSTLHRLARRSLPPAVAMAGGLIDDHQGILFPEELARIEAAREKRRQEFIAGRTCARRAMACLGMLGRPIRSGPRGEPRWPLPLTGSISHSGPWCVAIVASRIDFQGLGVDLEQPNRLDEPIARMVATPEERREGRRLPLELREHLDTLLFSAKESVFKCSYPLFRAELEFHDVKLVLLPDLNDPRQGRFLALISHPVLPDHAGLEGRFALDRELLMTVALLRGRGPRLSGAF